MTRVGLVVEATAVDPDYSVEDAHFLEILGPFTNAPSEFDLKVGLHCLLKLGKARTAPECSEVVAVYDQMNLPFSMVKTASTGAATGEPHGGQRFGVSFLPY